MAKLYSRRISFIPADRVGPTFPWPNDGHLKGFRFDWPPWFGHQVANYKMWSAVTIKANIAIGCWRRIIN